MLRLSGQGQKKGRAGAFLHGPGLGERVGRRIRAGSSERRPGPPEEPNMNLNRSLVFGLLLLLGAAPAAHAGTITIDFDLRASTISIPVIPVPPVTGSFPAASARVRVLGGGISTPLSGTATLKSLVWSYTFSAPVEVLGYAVTLMGSASGQQTGEVVGRLTAGLGNFVFDAHSMPYLKSNEQSYY